MGLKIDTLFVVLVVLLVGASFARLGNKKKNICGISQPGQGIYIFCKFDNSINFVSNNKLINNCFFLNHIFEAS